MKKLLILCFLLIPFFAHAQIGTNPANPYSGAQSQNPNYQGTENQANRGIKPDSGSLRNVYYSGNVRLITEQNLKNDSLTLSRLDTSLHNFENYSPLYQPGHYYLNLGNLGLAAKPLLPEFNRPPGFANGQTAFSLYELNPEDIQYYRNKSPFTDVFYISGKGQKSGFAEGMFRFVHARNINPRLNIGISYARVGSNGYYARQSSDVLNATVFAWYQSKNLRYNLLSNFIVNTVMADENGGVVRDSLFTRPTAVQHQYEPVYRNGAASKWNNYGLYVKQYYLIGKIDSVRDPLTRQIKVYPTARAYYTFHYKASTFGFNDNFSPGNSTQNVVISPALYYPNLFIDTLRTKDQASQSLLENELGLSLFGRSNGEDRHFSASGIRLDASLKDQLVHFKQNNKIDSNFHNVILGANAGYELSNRFNIHVLASYVLLGPNHSDTRLGASAHLDLSETLGFMDFSGSFEANSPELIYNRYESNSYSWNYHFNRVKTKVFSASWSNPLLAFKLGVEYNSVSNLLYFAGIANQVVFPSQYGSEVTIFRAWADKEFRFGKFGFTAHAVYQKNNTPFIVRTPELYAQGSLFAQNTYFKVLRIKAGVDASYFSKIYAYDYAPGLQQFFIYSRQQTGDYPVAGVFLLAGLKRTNLIFRYDYLNQGFPKAGYYNVHLYPMPDHLFKFGLSWKFYD